jgi:hypothetical protein
MKTSVYTLCDRATIREGLLHILGAGITTLGRPDLPAALDCDLALLLTPDYIDEITGSHNVAVGIYSDAGEAVAESQISFALDPAGQSLDPTPSLPFSVALRNVLFSTYGHYNIQLHYDGHPLGELRFLVEKQLSPGVTPIADSGSPN